MRLDRVTELVSQTNSELQWCIPLVKFLLLRRVYHFNAFAPGEPLNQQKWLLATEKPKWSWHHKIKTYNSILQNFNMVHECDWWTDRDRETEIYATTIVASYDVHKKWMPNDCSKQSKLVSKQWCCMLTTWLQETILQTLHSLSLDMTISTSKCYTALSEWVVS